MKLKPFAIAVFIIMADQITKYYFRHKDYSIGFLNLHFIKNYGAGFGILQGYRVLLIAIPILVSILIIYYLRDVDKGVLFYGLAFLLGGTIGNLVDRIFFGYVTDFIDVGFWPVFNIADMANSIGALLILIVLLRKE